VAFLEAGFFSLLKDDGWNRVHNLVFPRRRSSISTLPSHATSMLDLPVISIPCHIHGFHWVAVIRRVISGQVFFYSDDMNSASSEQSIKQVLSTSNPAFYPLTTIWITCNTYTYLLHSNECKIWTLLAL